MRQKTEYFSGQTHTGKVRDNNEDAFLTERILQDRYLIACVIDGVGGYEGGEVAATIAKESILEHLQKPSEDLFVSIREAVVIANERIYAEKMASDRNNRMACVLTLAVVDLTYNQFYYAHVGDTRLYLLRDRTLVKITRDDSFVGFLEDSKRLSEQEAMNHPKRNEISKALGFDPNIAAISDYIETGISPFLPGDLLLLCSDGLTDMIDSKRITSILTTKDKISQMAQALVDAANQAGGKDNVTAVLVRNINKPAALEATKPTIVKKNELQVEDGDQEEDDEDHRKHRPVKNRGWIIFLLLICSGLLGVLFWKFSQNIDPQTPLTPVTFIPRNVAEQKLQDSIRQSSHLVLADSIYGRLISLSDTIILAKDSIHINGNGIILRSDTAYHGIAMAIDADCKYVLLENIVFENFPTAIMSKAKAVQLKNVRFTNCNVALQNDLRFPADKYVNGLIVDTLFFKTDSLPK